MPESVTLHLNRMSVQTPSMSSPEEVVAIGTGLEGRIFAADDNTVVIGDTIDEIVLGNMKIATYRTVPVTWNAGTTQYASDDTRAFIRKFKDCRIYGMIGAFQSSTGNIYPASSPMFNTSGTYTATWGHRLMINTTNETLDVTVSSQWANYRACVTVIYGVDIANESPGLGV